MLTTDAPAASSWDAIRQDVLRRDGFRCVSCGEQLVSKDADVHHLLPRSMGGTDEMSNLVTLCDGCHASHHPSLAGGLARRVMEIWAVRLAKWVDRDGKIVEASGNFGPALRLFGVERFRSGQLPIVLAALAGHSILVISPTGSGKTLCFQLPALLRRGVSMVVCPLKTLMTEQVSSLLLKKIPATYINSDLSAEERQTRFALLTRRGFKLLYIAPERFFVRSEAERQQLKESKPSFLVIDEAHCVDQWGNDFRPEYGRLREVREKLGSPPVLAFTATAGKVMQERILHSLGIPDAKVFVRDVDRPNIATLRWECAQEDRADHIASLMTLPELAGEKAMIFAPSVRIGEQLQIALKERGLDLPFYHSRHGTSWERQELVKRFLGQSLPALDQVICTNAFGMGLDVPNVRLVIHWQQPASAEELLQEFGRAGRDGHPSLSVIFHDGKTAKDESLLKYMAQKTVEGSRLDDDGRAAMLSLRTRQIDQVSDMLLAPRCFRRAVREYFGDSAASPRLSLSERILEWLFGTAPRIARHEACCDHCDKAQLAERGRLGYAAWVLSKDGRS